MAHLCYVPVLIRRIFSGVALIEDTSLIGASLVHILWSVRNFLSLGGQIAASCAKLMAERPVEVSGKLVGNFPLNHSQV